jgi:hypothetical protein
MKKAWALLTLVGLGCMLWGASLAVRAGRPDRPASAAPLGDFEKEVLLSLGDLAKSREPAAQAFLQELRSDPVLAPALSRGVGPGELARFRAVLARYEPGLRAALAKPAAPEPSCGPAPVPQPKPSNPLAPPADSTCGPSAGPLGAPAR